MKNKELTCRVPSIAKRLSLALGVACLSLFSFESEAAPGAIRLDGDGNYIDIGYVLPGGHSYTKEAWIKANQSTTHNIITGDDDPFWLSGDHLRAAHGWQRIPSDIQDPETFPLGVWVHVAVTYDAANSTMKLYKNGIEVASSNTMQGYNTTYLQVGAYNSSNLFDGDIDEVRVWDRALCIGEIQKHMNGELTGSEDGLIVYYKLDAGILGTVNVLDASGHGNNGSLFNFLGGLLGAFVPGTVSGAADVFIPPVATATAAGATTVNMGGSVTVNANSTYAYQWLKNGAEIPGATTQSYTATETGNYAVEVTIENGCTNISTPVAVTVNQVAASVTAPANISACDNGNGNSKTLAVTITGVNSPVTTYAITGATTGTGTGTSVTKNFNKGVSNIKWTVTSGNSTYTATASVTIKELPVVTIATSKADAFCNELAVMAKSSQTGASTYNWTYNNANFASYQTIYLDNSNGDGNYSVKITGANGCTSNSTSYNYQKQNMAASYTLLAYKEVDLDNNNDVLSGAVGVMNSGGNIEIDASGSVPSPGFVKASYLDISGYANVPKKYYGQVSVTLPAMLTNTASTSGLSSYTKSSNGTINNSYKALTVNQYVTATINNKVFGKIKIGRYAKVTFTAADISIDSLEIGDHATVIFNQNTNFRVRKAVLIEDNVKFNTAAKKVSFFMNDAVSDITKFTVDYNSNVTANIFMPKGKLYVSSASNNDSWKSNNRCCGHKNNCNNSNTGTFMIGYFIAERIEGGENITWDNYTCVEIPVGRQAKPTEEETPIEAIANSSIGEVSIYPNPSNGAFTVALPMMDSKADVKVYDVTGKLIVSKSVAANEARTLSVNIENVAKGLYLVEVVGTDVNFKAKMIVR